MCKPVLRGFSCLFCALALMFAVSTVLSLPLGEPGAAASVIAAEPASRRPEPTRSSAPRAAAVEGRIRPGTSADPPPIPPPLPDRIELADLADPFRVEDAVVVQQLVVSYAAHRNGWIELALEPESAWYRHPLQLVAAWVSAGEGMRTVGVGINCGQVVPDDRLSLRVSLRASAGAFAGWNSTELAHAEMPLDYAAVCEAE